MYKRRIKVFFALVWVILLSLAIRLGYLQIVKGQDYLDKAEDRLRRVEMLPPTRGRILDSRGRILAIDSPCFELCMHYRFMISDTAWIARWIEKKEGVSPEQTQAICKTRIEEAWEFARSVAAECGEDLSANIGRITYRIGRMSRNYQKDIAELYQYHPIVTGISSERGPVIKTDLSDTSGLIVRPSHKRRYPLGDTACHVVGLMGRFDPEKMGERNPSENEVDDPDRLRDGYRSGDVIGIAGIEKMCEKHLRGRRGYRSYLAGKLIEHVPAIPGSDVQLTLDAELQDAIARAFIRGLTQGSTGAVVVLSVPEGKVLALVSIPTYDVNHYRRDFRQLIAEKCLLPLRHRAVAQCFAPGSTIKPAVALSALGAGKITPETEFHCDRGQFGPSPQWAPKCWIAQLNGEHGIIDLQEGLRFSCNVYFDHVGDALGPHLLCEWLRRFGFGAVPGTGLPEERGGVVPTDEWMRKYTRHSRGMSVADAWQMAIGQGALSSSPLHVANAMATIARGGRFIFPLLVTGGHENNRIERDLEIPKRFIDIVHEGMREVVHQPTGTANRYVRDQLLTLTFEICGKTGTAQVPPQR
ncbi:MAG: penicillin-binding transpeptidase domain-containing protein, partial [Planctomycetota bacterium]